MWKIKKVINVAVGCVMASFLTNNEKDIVVNKIREIEDSMLKMAGYISELDIDEDICKKVNCSDDIYEDKTKDECVNCIIKYFSKK